MRAATKTSSAATKVSMAFFAILTLVTLGISGYLFWVDGEIYVSGDETPATIVGKWTKERNTPRNREALTHNIAHYVRYRFSPNEGPSVADSQIVSKAFYDGVAVGDKVTARYSINNPDLSQVDRAEGSMGKYVALIIGLCLAAGVFYSWRFEQKATSRPHPLFGSSQ